MAGRRGLGGAGWAGWTVHWGARNSSLDPLIQRAKTGDRWSARFATTAAAKHVPSAAEGIAEWGARHRTVRGRPRMQLLRPAALRFNYTPDNGDESRSISPEIPSTADPGGVGCTDLTTTPSLAST